MSQQITSVKNAITNYDFQISYKFFYQKKKGYQKTHL